MYTLEELTSEIDVLHNKDICFDFHYMSISETHYLNILVFFSEKIPSRDPMVIVGESGNAFGQGYGRGFVLSTSKTPEVIAGDVFVDSDTLAKVKEWVSINYDTLIGFWEKRIVCVSDLLHALKDI